MPDYAEAAEKKGWVKKGAKWRHPEMPGVEKYNAKQIWDEYPEVRTRPLSISPREDAKPVEVKPDVAVMQMQAEAPRAEPVEAVKPRGRRRKAGFF